MLIRALIITTFVIAACHQSTGGNSASELQTSPQLAKQPLPITGTWQATEVWSSSDNEGSRKALHTTADELKDSLWRVKIDIDGDGNGLLQGLIRCTGPTAAMPMPGKLQSLQVMNAIFGLLSLPALIRKTVDGVQCANSSEGVLSSLLLVSPARNFFGQNLNSLPKNLGFFGEGKSISAADTECLKMRGVRFVNIKDSAACVGFTNGTANQTRFIIIPVGEIYAVRVNLRRD